MIITCLTHQLAETVTAKLRTPFITFLNVQHFNYTIREVLFENIFNLHINDVLTLDLLMFGNPNLDNMTKEAIFVHEYINWLKDLINYSLYALLKVLQII